jgi:hypothetical protein
MRATDTGKGRLRAPFALVPSQFPALSRQRFTIG